MATVLVADDEKNIVQLARMYLQAEGFTVETAANGREALDKVRQAKPDLLVLDLMMPELDGWEVTRRLRKESDIPIIMLTARGEDVDKIVGLELGADDYLTKPFNVRELVARVKAVLRRTQKAAIEPDVLRAAGIVLDRAGRTVKVGDRAVDLTPSEFAILATLMAAPGQVFSRLDLLDRVSGEAYEGYERTIDVHIRNLRTKIEPDPKNPSYIETVYGMGYRFATAKASGA